MDLNLPIVKAPEDADNDDSPVENEKFQGKMNGVKRGLYAIWETFFSGRSGDQPSDSDLQLCLDKYFEFELLEGDNQYYCDYCGCKQDAHRKPVLEKSPHVLNVQLSRYVYDRKKGMKKKLSDKVMLPQELIVNAASLGADSGEAKNRRYLLCAVMRHKGTSAYSGHYIAEAMDWLTGIWYEFNDEKVEVIDKPSCSYDQLTISKIAAQQLEESLNDDASSRTFGINSRKKGKKSKKLQQQLTGSVDAYNMYYVDEEYLRTSVMENLRSCDARTDCAEDQQRSLGSVEHGHLPDVIRETIAKRSNEFTAVAS